MDSRAFITKPVFTAKTIDHDVFTIFAEQVKDPVLTLFDHGYAREPRPIENHS